MDGRENIRAQTYSPMDRNTRRMEQMTAVETLSVNLETERFHYGLLMAADVEGGKVTDTYFWVAARVKKT